MNDNQPEVRSDIDKICLAVMADTEALEDAKMTLEVIKKTDPGVYDEMINDTLSLIRKALSSSILSVVDKLEKSEKKLEPAAWIYSYKGQKSVSMNYVAGVRAGPLYLSPLHAWGTVSDAQLIDEVRNRGFSLKGGNIGDKWNGLGSDDFNDFNPYFKAEEAARWAERKLKDKNNG